MSRSTSPLTRSVDMALDRTNSTNPSQIGLEEENAFLRKQIRQLETENSLTKALLEQKIELLESQIGEFKDREGNLKKMNETIMSALHDMNNRDQNPLVGKTAKELELTIEHHDKEMQEHKNRTGEVIRTLETENKKLQEELGDNERRVKKLQIEFEKAQMGFQQSVSSLEQEKMGLENRIKRMEEEFQQAKELNEYENNVKINELKGNNERIKEEFRKEIQKMKEEHEKAIRELKAAHLNERSGMEGKIDQSQALMVQEIAKREGFVVEMQEKHAKEVQMLKEMNSQMKAEHLKEVSELKRQKEEAYDKCEKLDSQIKKLKVTLKTSQHLQEQNSKLLKEKLEKAKGVMEHGENLITENKKYKQKIAELKSQVKNLEASEHKLKEILQDPRTDEEIKRRLNFDQSLSQSVQDPSLSQSTGQIKSARQSTSTVKVNEAPSYTSRKNNNLMSSVLSVTPSQKSQAPHSPLQGNSPMNAEKGKLNSQRSDRSGSSYTAITPPKYSKSPVTESLSQKPDNTFRTADMVTGRKSVERENENEAANTVATTQRMAPLETSFADHGFTIENDMDDMKTEKNRVDNERGERKVDVDSIPINYNEFLRKKNQAQQMIDPEKILSHEFENGTENSENTEQRIFFTTSQEENQPLFGTSHFMMEGLRDGEEQEGDEEELEMELARLNESSGKEKERKEKSVEKVGTEKERKDKKESKENKIYNGKENKGEEREKGQKAGKLREKGRIMKTDEDLDFEELSSNRERDNKGRYSVNLNRKESSGKSFTRDELETRTSMINPMHSVFDSGSVDTFQDCQGSLDLSTGNVRNKSIEREKEKEKIFSSRHSFSGSVSVGPGTGNKGGTRQKIEGRLKDLEWKLKDMEIKNKGLRVEKDKVQLEYEKLMRDLNEKKTESENMKNVMNMTRDEKKEEKEAALKNEIKFLINKLLKVKSKLEKQSEELNMTKTSTILSQSQVNYSTGNYHLPGKKDYSKEYGTLGGINNLSLTTQIKERENLTPVQMQNSSLMKKKNQPRGTWTENSQLNTSAMKPENYRMSERGHQGRSTLGLVLDNAAKNLRSKSNTRYEGEEEFNINIGKVSENVAPVILSSRSHRTKMPNLPKNEGLNMSTGPWLGREVLKPINVGNYESVNQSNVSAGYGSNNSFLLHRKSTR